MWVGADRNACRDRQSLEIRDDDLVRSRVGEVSEPALRVGHHMGRMPTNLHAAGLRGLLGELDDDEAPLRAPMYGMPIMRSCHAEC